MGIGLLADLNLLSSESRLGEFDTAFFLTYSLNLRFFEQLILPRLSRLGVVNVGILADEHGYQVSLDDPLGQEQCGRSYVVGTSPHLSNLQHAKMLWLHGERDLVYVGSHNLTMSGFNDQLEITAKLDSANYSHRHALRGVHQAVSTIVRGEGYLQKIWAKISQPDETDDEPAIYFLWSGEQGLLHQLVQIIGSAKQFRVVTPFLDPRALAELKKQFGANETALIIPNEGADTPLTDSIAAVPGLTALRVGAGIRLHGKAYWFKSESQQWLVLGSANCTLAGLVKGVPEGGNVEFLVVIPGSSLSEDELSLDEIDNVDELSGTGRRWDEERASSRLVRINSAEYSNGMLTVAWEPISHLSSVHLICGERRYPYRESPIHIPLETAPSIITLEAEADGCMSTARAWVIFPEELIAQVSKARARRWQEYLDSDDPRELAVGIDAYFLQLLRDLISSEVEGRDQFRELPRPGASEIKDAVEVFTFSSDKRQITSAAAVLVSGNSSIDPLGALRGLITRIRGNPPSYVEGDDKELTRYEERRQRAERRIADRLITHLNALSGPEQDWASTPSYRIMSCLRGTFEATALLWHDIVSDDPRYSVRERFVESFLQFLNACYKSEKTQIICHNNEVAGPLVLAIGAAAEAAIETVDYELLQEAAKKMVDDPQGIIKTWLQQHSDRATLLLTHGHGTSDLRFWLRPALHLLGQLDASTRNRQELRWRPLLTLYEAECKGDKSVSSLYEEAEREYGNHEVWQSYKATRAVGHLPKIKRVTSQVCNACCVQLPSSTRNRLEHGEAVLCPSCKAILLWGNT